MAGMMPYVGAEFVLEFIETLIVAFLIAKSGVEGFTCRVAMASGIGAVAALATNGSYHIWYAFPLDYSVGMAIIQFVQYTIAGLVLAKMLPKSATT